MSRFIHSPWVLSALLGMLLGNASGCGDAPAAEELSVEVSFAPGVPRSARDEAVRIEVYLVVSCDSVTVGERPADALGSMYTLRDGSGGPPIAVPDRGDYGLYAVAQNSDCAVVGAGCDEVSVDAASLATFHVELGAFSGDGCFAAQRCSVETGDCTGPDTDCVDSDSDGLGDGTLDNAACINATVDSDDRDGTRCADTDGDSCDDCSSGSFDPNDDGQDADADGICDAGDVCVDADGDGLGDGTSGNAGCSDTTSDSNDADGTVCADTDGDSCDDCSSGSFDPSDDGADDDGDGICDAGDLCVDMDSDGAGDGTSGNAGCATSATDSNDEEPTVCADTDGDGCDDCNSGLFDPSDDGIDADADGICDAGDDCVDADGDGLGDGSLGNGGCIDTTTDSNDGDGSRCADTDGDGCDDCALVAFDPSNDGTDSDGDGTCALGDCDDEKPLCVSVCTDVDSDGYCIDTDCNDAIPSCDLDCATNTDSDSEANCVEVFCGSDPNSSSSVCRQVSNQTQYENAIDAANSNIGHDYILLQQITIRDNPPKLNDDAGVTIRQVVGATLLVNAGGDRLVFEVASNNNLIDGVHIVNVLNARDVIYVQGHNNTIQDCVIEGFERRGIYVDGGDNAQLLSNSVFGGTNAQANEVGAIILRNSTGSVVSGNTLAQNAMDGLQVRNAFAPFIDHNTIADNGGSGIEFYSDDSSNVCLRNNNVTGNGEFGYNGAKVVTFDTSSACTGPLSAGPTYGNNAFDNGGGSCGGDECLACACLPAGSFWEYTVDPNYTSTSSADQDIYCLDPSSTLVDGGDDLVSYDLNGNAPGDFNGSGPDVGGREDGPGDCN